MSGTMLCKAFAHNAKGTMSKQGGHKPSDRDDPVASGAVGGSAGSGKEPPRDAASAIQEHIGRELRAMFEEVVAQPVPEKLHRLLEELARKQPKS